VSHYEDRGLRSRLPHEVFQLQDPIEDVNRALAELGLEARVVRIDDIGEAQARGVNGSLHLVVDVAIRSAGGLTVEEIRALLQEG